MLSGLVVLPDLDRLSGKDIAGSAHDEGIHAKRHGRIVDELFAGHHDEIGVLVQVQKHLLNLGCVGGLFKTYDLILFQQLVHQFRLDVMLIFRAVVDDEGKRRLVC